MSIEEQKKVADEVLDLIYDLDPFAIVAGGAPRDWYFEKEATDIDVFFYVSDRYNSSTKEKLMQRLGLNITRLGGESLPKGYQLNPNIYSVYECLDYEIPVQFIMMMDEVWRSAVPNFPMSICKAWYKDHRIGYDTDFKISVKHNVVYKTNDLYADGQSYIQKIRGKFPYPEWNHFCTKEQALTYIAMKG